MADPPPRKRLTTIVTVVDEDSDVAQDLSAPRLEQARRESVARLVVLGPGESFPLEDVLAGRGGLGLLVLDGAVVRSLAMGDRNGLELFGPGDLVRPSESAGEAGIMMPTRIGWWALCPTHLAVLDARFTSRMCSYPEVIDQLTGRLERRSSNHALRLTIMQQPRLPTRLHLLLWHLADRFGRMHPEGVVLPLALSHEVLAQLVGAQRPSVSRALKELERGELIARLPDGTWRLGDQPPPGART